MFTVHSRPRMAGEEGSCGVCGTAAKLRCGGCSNVHYCCRDHQRKHWAQHREECRPIKQIESPQDGRYLVASRDLAAGQLVLNESPVVCGPTGTCFPLCLGCHSAITDLEAFRCPGCFWPMCSPECHQKDLHAKECGILAQDVKRVGPPTSLGVTPRYDMILVLRCLLLRESNPTIWDRLMTMESHVDARREQQEPYHMAGVRFLTEVLNCGFDADTVHRVRGIMITNCINIRGSKGEHLRGIYPNIALLNHSCLPNLTIRSDVNNALYIRTAVAIKKGDPLVFSYTPPEEPLWERQFDFRNVYFFSCKCRRCGDPTELGTHYSSPRCPKCPEKFLEPRDGVDAPWKCPECGEKRESQEIKDEAERHVKDIDERCSSAGEVESFLTGITRTFHDSHYVWVTAAQASLRVLKNDTSLAALKLQQEIWRRLMGIYQLFEPGLTRRRGVSLFQLSMVETRVAQTQRAEGELTPPAYIAALARILRQLEYAAQILELEPSNSSERHWKARATEKAAAISEAIAILQQSGDSHLDDDADAGRLQGEN